MASAVSSLTPKDSRADGSSWRPFQKKLEIEYDPVVYPSLLHQLSVDDTIHVLSYLHLNDMVQTIANHDTLDEFKNRQVIPRSFRKQLESSHSEERPITGSDLLYTCVKLRAELFPRNIRHLKIPDDVYSYLPMMPSLKFLQLIQQTHPRLKSKSGANNFVLARIMEAYPNLETVTLEFSRRLSDDVFKVLGRCQKLQSLELHSHYGVSATGSFSSLSHLSGLSTLQSLNLGAERVCDGDLADINKLSIKRLRLNGFSISDKGWAHLGSSLEELYSMVSSPSAEALCHMGLQPVTTDPQGRLFRRPMNPNDLD